MRYVKYSGSDIAADDDVVVLLSRVFKEKPNCTLHSFIAHGEWSLKKIWGTAAEKARESIFR